MGDHRTTKKKEVKDECYRLNLQAADTRDIEKAGLLF